MGRQLTIPYYRPQFVEKSLSEVGDGTAWPMEATLDQVAEIFYRVKDAWFTSGSLNNFGEDNGISSFVGAPSTDKLAGIDLYSTWWRGHCFSDDSGVNTSAYALWAYYPVDVTDGMKPSKFKAPYTLDGYGYQFYDILDDETGPWQTIIAPDETNPPRFWDTCAFNHQIESGHATDEPPTYGIFSTSEFGGQASLSLKVGSSVAWVGGDGPFDPTARLFIEIGFGMGYDFESNYITSYPYTGAEPYDPVSIKLVIKLHGESNTCSCSLYGNFDLGESDLVIEAKKWWPYNTETDGSGDPVWNTATGAKL